MAGLTVPLRRVLRSGYATSGWSTILLTLLSGVAGVIAARALGPYERGLLATAVAWSSVVGSLSVFGLPSVATYFAARDEGRPPRAASTVIAVGGSVGLLLALIGVAICLLVIGGPAGPALAVSFASLAPSLVAGAGLGALLGLGRYQTWGVLRIAAPALTLIGTLAVVAADWTTALAITLVTSLALVVQTGLLGAALKRRDLVHRPSGALVRPVLAYTSRNVVSGFGWLLALRLDQLVLSVAVNPSLLGIYAVSVSFGAVIQPVAASTGSVVLQRVSHGGVADVRRTLRTGLTGAAVTAFALSAVTFVFAPQLVRVLFGEAFEEAVPPLRVGLVGTVALVIASVLADLLRGLGRPLAPARPALLGALVTVIGLPIALPTLDILGAAIVSSVSYTTIMVAMALSARSALRETARTSATEPPGGSPGPSPVLDDRSASTSREHASQNQTPDAFDEPSGDQAQR